MGPVPAPTLDQSVSLTLEPINNSGSIVVNARYTAIYNNNGIIERVCTIHQREAPISIIGIFASINSRTNKPTNSSASVSVIENIPRKFHFRPYKGIGTLSIQTKKQEADVHKKISPVISDNTQKKVMSIAPFRLKTSQEKNCQRRRYHADSTSLNQVGKAKSVSLATSIVAGLENNIINVPRHVPRRKIMILAGQKIHVKLTPPRHNMFTIRDPRNNVIKERVFIDRRNGLYRPKTNV